MSTEKNESELSQGQGHEFAMRKTAGFFAGMKHVGRQVSDKFQTGSLKDIMDAGKISAGAVTTGILGSYGVKKIMDSIQNNTKEKAMLENLMLTDPIIKDSDPEKVKQYFATIKMLAPKLSGDVNVVRNLLQNFLKFDTIDLASIKALTDTQKSMHQGRPALKDMKI